MLLLFTVIIVTNTNFFGYILYLTYASKVRGASIIVPYGDDSKASIRLSGRGRSCIAFVRPVVFGLGIALKEKRSRLSNPVSIQK